MTKMQQQFVDRLKDRKIVAFQNCNRYPVSFFIKGIISKIYLEPGQQILDRKGALIIPEESEWRWLCDNGVRPVTPNGEIIDPSLHLPKLSRRSQDDPWIKEVFAQYVDEN